MKISIQKIIRSEVLQFEEKVDISEIESWNNDIRRIDPVLVKGTMHAQGNQITCQMTLKGIMILPCARTLIDVEYPFELEATELFSISPYYNEEDESEIHPVEGELLDLEPYVKENVILGIPFRVFASEKQLAEHALTSGNGWELVLEEKKEETIDPRLRKLQFLLDKENKENQ